MFWEFSAGLSVKFSLPEFEYYGNPVLSDVRSTVENT